MTLKNIEEEYDLFQTKITTVKTKEDLEVYIQQGTLDIVRNIKSLRIDYNNNRIEKLFAKVKNIFFFADEEVDFYNEDDKLLDEILLLNLIYENYFQTILINATDDNSQELIKLLDFLTIYYEKNENYIESKRDNLKYKSKGFSCINYRYEDCFMVVDEFFDKKIKDITGIKSVEKVKKI